MARSIRFILVGVTAGFQKIRNLLVLQGRYLDQDDLRTKSKVCLLTPKLSPICYFRLKVRWGKTSASGSCTSRSSAFTRNEWVRFGQTEIRQESVIVPFSLIKYYTGTEFFKTFYVQADKPEDVPMVTSQVRQVLAEPASL